MVEMFFLATSFNQDLTEWCVEQFTAEPFGFADNSGLENNNKPIWGTCPD
jgi:hypothetical protein